MIQSVQEHSQPRLQRLRPKVGIDEQNKSQTDSLPQGHEPETFPLCWKLLKRLLQTFCKSPMHVLASPQTSLKVRRHIKPDVMVGTPTDLFLWGKSSFKEL